MGYYNKCDIIYKIGTAEFRRLCLLGMTAGQKIKAVDKALNEKGISTEGWGPEDYQKAIETLSSGKYYGIEFDVTVANPICTRIGDLQLHKTLPIHSKMRGCLLADDGTVIKYLNSEDWTSEVRDGSQGQVMVEIPEYWIRFETDGNKRRVYISEAEMDAFTRVPKCYVSAYEATVDRLNVKLCSIVNRDPQFRGGNSQSDWDNLSKSLLGLPATQMSRRSFSIAARNRTPAGTEWNIMTYEIYKNLFWLYYIEYANLNCQAAYTGERDVNGYRQGSLGPGVTIVGSANWNEFNGYYPFVPCGHTDSLGNGTGVVPFQLPDDFPGTVKTVSVPRWRGIENIFGHIWKHCDGVIVDVQASGAGGESKVYIFKSPDQFSDKITEDAVYIGNQYRGEGYLKEVVFGDNGEIIAKSLSGGSSTTYFCDYCYNTNLPSTGSALRTLFLGGHAHSGASAGLGCLYSTNGVTAGNANIGSRLCYIPR